VLVQRLSKVLESARIIPESKNFEERGKAVIVYAVSRREDTRDDLETKSPS